MVAACSARALGSARVHRAGPAGGGGAVAQHILAAVDRLGQYPFYGRAAAWDSGGLLRELPVPDTPFVVVYEVNETVGAVNVLRVVHSW